MNGAIMLKCYMYKILFLACTYCWQGIRANKSNTVIATLYVIHQTAFTGITLTL